MGNDFFEKRRAESQEMIDNAIANSQQSENKVHVSIDSVGAIKALVFGKEGIVSVEPCYDDEVAGKFAHRLAYPNEKKLKQIFAERTGIADISFDDDKFIEFVMQEIEEQSKGAEWNGVSWDHKYSRYKDILYSSMQEAVSAMWSEDVFCGKRKEKSIMAAAKNVADDRRTGTVKATTSEIREATTERDDRDNSDKEHDE